MQFLDGIEEYIEEVTTSQVNATFSLGDTNTSSSASAVYFHEGYYDVALGNSSLRYEVINSTMFCGSSGFDASLKFAMTVYAESFAVSPTLMMTSSESGMTRSRTVLKMVLYAVFFFDTCVEVSNTSSAALMYGNKPWNGAVN